MAICLQIFVRCLRYTCFSFFLTFSLILLNCFFLIMEAIVHRVMCAIVRFIACLAIFRQGIAGLQKAIVAYFKPVSFLFFLFHRFV